MCLSYQLHPLAPQLKSPSSSLSQTDAVSMYKYMSMIYEHAKADNLHSKIFLIIPDSDN